MIDPTWDNARMEAYLRGLSLWRGEVGIEPLVGGLCNKSFVVSDESGRYVARIGSDILVHGIAQTSVRAAMAAASDAGVTPKLRYSEPGLAVVLAGGVGGSTLLAMTFTPAAYRLLLSAARRQERSRPVGEPAAGRR